PGDLDDHRPGRLHLAPAVARGRTVVAAVLGDRGDRGQPDVLGPLSRFRPATPGRRALPPPPAAGGRRGTARPRSHPAPARTRRHARRTPAGPRGSSGTVRGPSPGA